MNHSEEPPAIAAAIIVDQKRVLLICRRQAEGSLLWTFPSGKIEAGETGEDAAVRETREEVGMIVRAVKTLGERIHPSTGCLMIYVVCEALAGEAHVADADEVTAVEWCSRKRVTELVPYPFFEPVQAHLDANVEEEVASGAALHLGSGR
ncbi:NUDIX hydrolase [Nonomuraea sp. NPDC049504]|uniref:NUDIX hydrolase n=1 Tax=Nonomuraea sp. NPDC049504 TaxID=3154729 RepID=UPI00343718A2